MPESWVTPKEQRFGPLFVGLEVCARHTCLQGPAASLGLGVSLVSFPVSPLRSDCVKDEHGWGWQDHCGGCGAHAWQVLRSPTPTALGGVWALNT